MNSRGISSTVATTVVDPAVTSAQRIRGGAGAARWAWLAAGVALGFAIPVFGSLIGYIPSRIVNKMDAQAEHDSLAKRYSVQIAQRLGKNPMDVTRDDLYEVAAKDINFSKLLQSSQEQKASSDRSALVGAGVGSVLHGAGAVKAIASNIAADMGVAAIFGKEELYLSDAADHLDAKRAAGQPVVAEDMFMLRIAQNDRLAAEIQEKMGRKFHKLEAKDRMAVMENMPELYNAAMADADDFNSGRKNSQQLATEAAPQRAAAHDKWADRVGGRKTHAARSHRERVDASRVTANNQLG